MSVISQLCKMWFVKKDSGDRRHGLFIKSPDGGVVHIHVSPYNMKHMVTGRKRVEVRVFMKAPEVVDSVLPASELAELLFAAAKVENCELSKLDVVFNDSELLVMLGEKEISRIDFEDEDEVKGTGWLTQGK